DGHLASVVEQPGEAAELAADEALEIGADRREDVARAHDQAVDHADLVEHLVAGQALARRDEDVARGGVGTARMLLAPGTRAGGRVVRVGGRQRGTLREPVQAAFQAVALVPHRSVTAWTPLVHWIARLERRRGACRVRCRTPRLAS